MKADDTVKVVLMIGLSVLLYLAGTEIDIHSLRGRVCQEAFAGFGASLALAFAAGVVLDVAGVVHQPLLVAVIFTATSLGIVAPVLRDGMNTATPVGQFVLAGAAIGDGAAIVLLSLLFSKESSDTSTRIVLLVSFAVIVALFAWVGSRRTMTMPFGRILERLQDTNALVLLVVRGLPSLAFHRSLGWRGAAASGLLLATSLPFIVAATQIGIAAGTLTPSIAAAMVAAGLISALVFPIVGSALLAPQPEPVLIDS